MFPFLLVRKKDKAQKGLFENVKDNYIRNDVISAFILEQVKFLYSYRVVKEYIFFMCTAYYLNEYRIFFANDIKKMLSRLSLVEKATDFWTFSKQGGNFLAFISIMRTSQA
jgi:predicted helicase